MAREAGGSRTARGARPLLTVASLAVALAAADTYVVVLALTDMMAGVGVGIESLQRGTPIISGFLLGYIAVLPLIGRLPDLTERQRVLLTCLAIFVVGHFWRYKYDKFGWTTRSSSTSCAPTPR